MKEIDVAEDGGKITVTGNAQMKLCTAAPGFHF